MRNTLDSLEAFIYALNVDYIFIGGDYNVDFLRTNAHTTEFNNFLNNVNLTPCINALTHTVTFTRRKGDVTSCIDYFSVLRMLVSDTACAQYALIDNYDISEVNLSDHSPLLLNINFASYGLHKINMFSGSSRSCLRAAWNKATDDNIANYQVELSHIVDKILRNIPADCLHCTNTTCRLHNHRANSNDTTSRSVIDGHTTSESIANAFKDQ